MAICKNVLESIGNTALIELGGIEREYGLNAKLYGKLECMNPGGSIKDRAAYFMLKEAAESGRLQPGGTVIEPTSGNTGIGLALCAALLGYRLIITMPDTMSVERRMLMSAYGAELVLTDGAKGMSGAIEKAEELRASIPGSIIAGQFENPANALAHYETTGPEILADAGDVDYLVATVGTGGTITGLGHYFNEKSPSTKIIGVEPAGSPVLGGGQAGKHAIQGIGAGFIPELLDRNVLDEVIAVCDDDAYSYARNAAKTDGILVGISSGAAIAAAVEIARRPGCDGKAIVVILPDSGSRYLSSGLYEA